MTDNLSEFTKGDFSEKLEKDLKFQPENLNQAYIEQASKFAFWATLAVQAKSKVDKKKLEIEQQDDFIKKMLVGKLDPVVRRQLEDNSEKVTEAKVTNGIYVHPEYVAACNKLYKLQEDLWELQLQWNLLSTAKDALVQRKDMIISLGANLRQELNHLET